jgi:hypothetical protein
MDDIIDGLQSDAAELAAGASVLAQVVAAIVPSPAPTSIPDAISSVASVYAAHPTDFFASAFDLVLNGLAPKDLIDLAIGESPIENSSNNINLILAIPPVYPKKSPQDALYSVSENTLRSGIYFPWPSPTAKSNLSSSFPARESQPARTLPGTSESCSQAQITPTLFT